MNYEEFVEAVYKYIALRASTEVIETLRKPVGRRPSKEAIQRSEKYENLSDEAKEMCEWVAKDSIDAALFGLFCVFDGARNINEAIANSRLRLTLQTESETIILADNIESLGLHDYYNFISKLDVN